MYDAVTSVNQWWPMYTRLGPTEATRPTSGATTTCRSQAGRTRVYARYARKPYSPTYVIVWPLGKLDPPRGAAITRTSTPATGRGRSITALTSVATSAVPHAPIIASASRGSRARASPPTMAGAISRLCGGKPGHETVAMSLVRSGFDQRCSLTVTARSMASLRRARTSPKIARKPTRPSRSTASAARPRRTAVRGGATSTGVSVTSITRGASPRGAGRTVTRPAWARTAGCNRREGRCTLPSPSATPRPHTGHRRGTPNMPRIVRGALVQASWTGDKETMIQKHEERAHEAAKDGAQVILFQELFYGPYFCQVQDAQYYSYTELIPDGPTTKRMQDLAKQTGMVVIAPMYEEDSQASGIYYNTAAVIDADGRYLGKYRKTHIPHVKGFWEKFYFRPGNLGYPVFETAIGRVGVYICYDRHFPEGARILGLNGAEIVFIPSATSRGLSEYLWRIEQVSHAVANGYFVGTINRVGIEKDIGEDDFYGQSYFCNPRGQFIGSVGSPYDEELIVRDMDLDVVSEVRQTWQFYRDRRPDAYGDLVRP